MKTVEEIEALKIDWASDPSWDIEDTEGFEEHYDELLAYRKQKELEWRQKAQANLEKAAVILGCPDNLQLARYVMSLEDRIESLSSRLEKLENA
jgi:polyhydroxyalkanoate synthesis regulator phasin